MEYYENFTDPFPYVATFKASSSVPIQTVTNYLKINCVTKRDRRILHSWEYSSFGSDEVMIKYDKLQKRILCCSKSGLSPIHQMAKCETPTDCNIKENCFSTSRCDFAYSPKFIDAPKGCTAVDVTGDFPSHVMKCSVGQASKIVPITSTILNDDVIIYDGTTPSAEKIIKISALSQKLNNQVRIRCIASLFYFSTNLVFAYETKSGAMQFYDESLVENSNSYGPILQTTIDADTKRIYCFAPLTRSSEWINVSIPIVGVVDDAVKKVTSTTTIRRRVHHRLKPKSRRSSNISREQ